MLSQLQLALDWNKDIADFLAWKESHESKCESNFDGSSGSMEPVGLVKIFKCSLDYIFAINTLFLLEITVL